MKTIIHVDIDAFYPSVEVLDNPSLAGKPVVVGGSRQRGVVSSASYEARNFGIHSAQPMAVAMRLCPQAIFLPVRMSRYREVSRRVFEVLSRFSPILEPISIDEAFLDVTGCRRLFGTAAQIAQKIKESIRKECGLSVSVGIAPSKFIAKIATDTGKPDGLTIVEPEKVREFLDPLPIRRMWGVGEKTLEVLKGLNVKTFKDIRYLPAGVIEEKFGKHGMRIRLLSMGIDDRDVIPFHESKSVSIEQTFPRDIVDKKEARRRLLSFSHTLARRMRREKLQGKTVGLKVRYHDFKQANRAQTLPQPTDDGFTIYRTACGLLERTEIGRRPIRLLGISMSQITEGDENAQLELFNNDKDSGKRRALNIALDSLHERFGENSIRPATLLEE